MSARTPLARLLCLLLLLIALPAAAQTQLEVFELRHRTATEIIAVARPHLDAQTRLSGDGFRLIVRGTPAEIAAVQALLERLDTPARSLRISVRGESGASGSRRGGELGNRSVRVYASEGARDQRQQHSVLAMDGRPARIHTGTAIPLRVDRVLLAEQGIAVHSGTEFMVLESGFYATARVSGERVLVEIAADQASFPDGGRLQSQTVVTTVSGRLDEWLPLGDSGSSGGQNERGLIYRSDSARASGGQLWLRVSAAD